MKEVVINVDGMMCGMCEAHVNDAIRKAVNPKKVESSHKKKTTTVICEDDVSLDLIISAITKGGYNVLNVEEKPYVKKGFFR